MSNILSLSLFGSGKRESHEQDGETLSRAHHAQIGTASGDPAMAFLVFHRLARTDTPFAALGGCFLSMIFSCPGRHATADSSKPAYKTRAETSARETVNGECRAFR
jgi:hypothetical protein